MHRHHLHNGLVEVAREHGVNIIIDSRIAEMEQLPDGRVSVTSAKGKTYTFDLVVGSDGVGSFVRQALFPDVKPKPPTSNCAYRAIVPFDEVRKDPLTRELVEDNKGNPIKTMEVWMAPTGYIISYPIADGRDFNMVLSHFRNPPVDSVQPVDAEEVRQDYRDYDPRICRIIEKIPPGVSRWPLLVTGPMESWSNPEKNVVLIGDAAHSMTNHVEFGKGDSTLTTYSSSIFVFLLNKANKEIRSIKLISFTSLSLFHISNIAQSRISLFQQTTWLKEQQRAWRTEHSWRAALQGSLMVSIRSTTPLPYMRRAECLRQVTSSKFHF